jgi:ADP-ribose pyrophosphatase YjhB (NUDIX family)
MHGEADWVRVVRRTARAILIDGDRRLVVFRRTLPKRKPYWSTPGGGVDATDSSVEAALHRELAEELGASVDRTQQVFLASPARGDGIAIQHFFVCRLVSMDLTKRTGSEFSNPAKGRYDVERIDLRGKKLARYDLQPPEVKRFILANRQALLDAALNEDAPPTTRADAAAVPAAERPPTGRPARTWTADTVPAHNVPTQPTGAVPTHTPPTWSADLPPTRSAAGADAPARSAAGGSAPTSLLEAVAPAREEPPPVPATAPDPQAKADPKPSRRRGWRPPWRRRNCEPNRGGDTQKPRRGGASHLPSEPSRGM